MISQEGLSPNGRYFAHALEGESIQSRVVTVDSGFIGTCGTMRPGPGLIECGDNKRFIKNMVRWLGGELI
jgi:hypothetical protein